MSERTARRRSLTTVADTSMAAGLIAIVLGSVVVWISFGNLLEARSRIFDRLQPALVQTQQLRTALVDQETGVRGFSQARDLRVLAPYLDGQAAERRLTADLRDLIGETDPAIERQLLAVTRVAAMWREEVADPLVRSETRPEDLDVLRSTAAFNDVRREVNQLDDLVDASASSARSDLNTATTSLAISIGIAVAGVTVASFFAAWLLRTRVVRPIEELVTQTDVVDRGRFDAVIDVAGPTEIEQLATRVDDMRRRILSQLEVVEATAAELDRRSESLERSNRDLEQFAYVASHDLQEPLRKVASFCQLLEQRYGDQLDDKGRLYIDYAVDGAKRMQALIADLLDFSRVGRDTGGFTSCDTGAIVARVVAASSDAIAETGAEVIVGELPTVVGDESLLGALFQNLLGNALKYRRPDVAPRITVDAVEEGAEWTFTFADNGIGIDEGFRERVFVIFQRLHGREAYEGTGIGLALCKKIVEFHGGRIWIDEPSDGLGTVVRWTLPTAGPHHDEPGYSADAGVDPDRPAAPTGRRSAPRSPA